MSSQLLFGAFFSELQQALGFIEAKLSFGAVHVRLPNGMLGGEKHTRIGQRFSVHNTTIRSGRKAPETDDWDIPERSVTAGLR